MSHWVTMKLVVRCTDDVSSFLLVGVLKQAPRERADCAALTERSALTRTREAAPIPACSDADRPAPAGSAALRLLADVDISF